MQSMRDRMRKRMFRKQSRCLCGHNKSAWNRHIPWRDLDWQTRLMMDWEPTERRGLKVWPLQRGNDEIVSRAGARWIEVLQNHGGWDSMAVDDSDEIHLTVFCRVSTWQLYNAGNEYKKIPTVLECLKLLSTFGIWDSVHYLIIGAHCILRLIVSLHFGRDMGSFAQWLVLLMNWVFDIVWV